MMVALASNTERNGMKLNGLSIGLFIAAVVCLLAGIIGRQSVMGDPLSAGLGMLAGESSPSLFFAQYGFILAIALGVAGVIAAVVNKNNDAKK